MRNPIDQSLNLLKELEVKLKQQHSSAVGQENVREQRYQRKQKPKHSWGDRLVTCYEQSEKTLESENRRLKKYVNRLLKMNDYLKNQLVRRDNYGKQEGGQIGALKLQIEYLQQINREKQLQIEIYRRKMAQQNRIEPERRNSTLFQRLPSAPDCSRPSRKLFSKNTIRRQDSNPTIRKSSKKKKQMKCPLCY